MKILYSVLLFFFFSTTFSLAQTKFQRLIVFGDSLSDVGTYSTMAGVFGGGKFTTNPGKIWIEVVADAIGLPMQPNRLEGLGRPTKILGGFNYAQGGARVVLERGQKDPEVEKLGVTARPIATQVQLFLQQHKNFQNTDLVFIQGGGNDIFFQISELHARRISIETAIKNVSVAAGQLNGLIQTLKKYGANNVVILSLPYIQKTPFIAAMNPQMQNAVEKLVQTFNSQLVVGARMLGTRLIDLAQFEKFLEQNLTKYGIKNTTRPACSLRFLPNDSALYCSPKNFVEPQADRTYKYADMVHPTTGYSQLLGKFVISELAR
jgi:phospholipase/lecithinase/hemolysin